MECGLNRSIDVESSEAIPRECQFGERTIKGAANIIRELVDGKEGPYLFNPLFVTV